MENRKEIAERLGISPRKLGSVLSTMKFKPTEIKVEGNYVIHMYDKEAVAKIEAIFKLAGETHA